MRVLTTRHLNRAMLARQLLLERAALPIADVVDLVGGLQTQYAPSGYVGLWSRVVGFERDDLTSALETHAMAQGTLLRATIHVVTAREYWRYAAGIRVARRAWSLRIRPGADEASQVAAASVVRERLADGPVYVKDLGVVAEGFLGHLGVWLDLVRVPPSGTWERRRADRLALAESWLGPCDATEEEGLAHLVRAYLRAFGPAPWKAISMWAGVGVGDLRRVEASLDLVQYADEDGRELLDLTGAQLPDPDTVAPVRFLPHWDAMLLAHARRTGVLPEEHRTRVFNNRQPFSVGTVLIDGRVAAGWTARNGAVVVDPFETLAPADRDAVEAERAALEAFHR
jgi:hypothetical protein